MLPGLASTCPRSTSLRSTPRNKHPTLSPAWPASSNFWNISTPVHVTVRGASLKPTISTLSPTASLFFRSSAGTIATVGARLAHQLREREVHARWELNREREAAEQLLRS